MPVDRSDLFTAALIFFVGLSSFGLGRLSALWPKKEPITIQKSLESASQISPVANSPQTGAILNPAVQNQYSVQGKYVASKNGGSYHFPWCSGAQRIKEENKIWFQTKEEAEKRGYKPAANCNGL